MNRTVLLEPAYRVSQAYVELSAVQPVRVGTYLYYRAADGWRMPDPPDDFDKECGLTNRIVGSNRVDPHDHDYYEIVLVRGGSALHQTALNETPVSAGTAIVMSPGQVHAFERIDGLQNTNVYYLTEWLLNDLRSLWNLEGVVPLFLSAALFRREVSGRVPVFPLAPEEMASCVHELRDILAETEQPKPSLDYMKWCFQKFLMVLSRAYLRAEPNQPMLGVPEEIQQTLEKLEEYILEGETLHVAALAHEAGMSADYFGKVFKDATGWSPMDYFQRRRIQHASWMLLSPQYSITEVAYTLGYCDSAHFSHLFKRHQGVSPRAFRKLYAPDARTD